MKKLIFAAFILVTTMAFVALGQTRPQTTPPRPTATPLPRPAATPIVNTGAVPDARIALIDTAAFNDEKNGIIRYVDAAKSVEAEFKTRTDELQGMQNRLVAMATEIQNLQKSAVADQKAIQAKQQQGIALQNDLKTKKDPLDEDISKRYEVVVGPISNLIGTAMDQFAKARGVTMTLDASKLLPVILTAVPAIDLTQAFINDFNTKNPRVGPAPRP
ncbi:MAG TPA: OmpH family outer membrane protein [Pyrinomonadaceae bacterium]|nr:OmpH family outer membrane protein [Pyrinomonadaceae bacterium]